jgi:hypothetical protein
MTGSTLSGGLGNGVVLGAATAVILPQTGILPKTGSELLITVTISALIATVISIASSKIVRKLR